MPLHQEDKVGGGWGGCSGEGWTVKHAAAVRRVEGSGGGEFRLMDAGRVGEQLSQVETD